MTHSFRLSWRGLAASLSLVLAACAGPLELRTPDLAATTAREQIAKFDRYTTNLVGNLSKLTVAADGTNSTSLPVPLALDLDRVARLATEVHPELQRAKYYLAEITQVATECDLEKPLPYHLAYVVFAVEYAPNRYDWGVRLLIDGDGNRVIDWQVNRNPTYRYVQADNVFPSTATDRSYRRRVVVGSCTPASATLAGLGLLADVGVSLETTRVALPNGSLRSVSRDAAGVLTVGRGQQ